MSVEEMIFVGDEIKNLCFEHGEGLHKAKAFIQRNMKAS